MLLFCPLSPDNWVWIRQITMSILRPYTYKHVLVRSVPAGNPGHNRSSVALHVLPWINRDGSSKEISKTLRVTSGVGMIKTHPCSKTISVEHSPRCCSPSPAIVTWLTSLYEYNIFKWDAKRYIDSTRCLTFIWSPPPPVVECGQCCHSEF